MKIYSFVTAALIVFAVTNAAAEKRYTIPQLRIEAQVLGDGGMRVSETRTYAFSGSFSYAFRTFPKSDAIRFSDFDVSEGGVSFVQNDSKDAATFRLVEEKEQTVVYWYYKSRNERRTFTIRYRVENLIKRYQDAAVLYYQFISPEWRIAQKNIEIVVHPPTVLGAGQLREWVHGPLSATSQIEPEGVIRIHCGSLPSRTFLEIRALYPSELFPSVAISDRSVMDEVLREEAALAEKANQQREKARAHREKMARLESWVKPVVLTLAGFSLVIWLLLYNRYGRRPERLSVYTSAGDIPDNMPPALVGYLLNWQTTSANDLAATVMDLARRGFVNVEEGVDEKGRFTRQRPLYSLRINRKVWRERRAELLPFEQSLLSFLFDELFSGQDAIELKALKKKSSQLGKFFGAWQGEIKEAAKEQNFYDPESTRAMYLGMIFGGVFFVLGLATLPIVREWALCLVLAGIGLCIASFFIRHHTAEGAQAYERWKGLKRYIKKYEFRSMDRTSLLSRLDRYIVYGLVFGLYKKHYQQLTSDLGSAQAATFFPWYAIHGGTGSFSPASFSASFSAMVSAMSSPSGFGGGAVVGGGAGAASGGGGAG